MDEKLKSALKELCSGEDAGAIVTIIKVQGSAPRKAGTKMLITKDGQVFGTIDGGCGEAEVKRQALHALDDVKPAKYIVNMTQDLVADEGMVCGGVMEVLIDIMPPDKNKQKQFMQEYIKALENDEEPVLMTVLDTSAPIILAGKFFVTSSGKEVSSFEEDDTNDKLRLLIEKSNLDADASLIKDGEIELFIETAPAVVELVILGGGHIGLPLCNIAKILGYHVTVVDDRPVFANVERFNNADRVICNDFSQAIKSLEFSLKSYVVIVTRGHRHDKLCLKAVINQPTAYIGMIGSKRRVKALLTEMIDEGTPADAVAQVHSPVGLDIGAQTPEEIAVSILAEVISVQRRVTRKCRDESW